MTNPPPNYCTVDDLVVAGVPVEVIDGIAGDRTVRDAKLLGMLNKRSRFADGYVGRAFVLPLSEWGDDLRMAVAELTGWDVMSVLVGFNPESPSGATWQARRDEALRWLEGVAAKRIVPPQIVDSATPEHDDGIGIDSDVSRDWERTR